MGSILGTTGAAMLFVCPLIQANTGRLRKAHVVIFFIVLVCNVGGALTPLGNPPLFAGFLHGVDFFWPAQNVWMADGNCGIAPSRPVLQSLLVLPKRGAASKQAPVPANSAAGLYQFRAYRVYCYQYTSFRFMEAGRAFRHPWDYA